MLFSEIICLLQFQRKSLDSHLQSNMQEHLDLACVKLNSTQIQLDEQQIQLSALQRQIDKKANTDKDDGNNRFIWKIKSFSERLKLVKEGRKKKIESDPFYTSCYGYKFKVFIAYPQVTGSFFLDGPRLSIGIVLMEGEYDDILPWPFSKRITFTIIDQNKDLKERQNHMNYLSPSKPELFSSQPKTDLFSKRPRDKETVVEGEIPYFISHKKLETRHYIVNDTLFLQVDVDPLD